MRCCSGKMCASEMDLTCFMETYRGFSERCPGQNFNNGKGEVIGIYTASHTVLLS